MGAHPLPRTPTPVAIHHPWRLEPSDRLYWLQPQARRKRVGLRDDHRTSALLILAGGVDAKTLQHLRPRGALSTIRSLMIRPSEGRSWAGGLVSFHAIGP